MEAESNITIVSPNVQPFCEGVCQVRRMWMNIGITSYAPSLGTLCIPQLVSEWRCARLWGKFHGSLVLKRPEGEAGR